MIALVFVSMLIFSGLKSIKLTNLAGVVHNVLSIFISFTPPILHYVFTEKKNFISMNIHLNKFLDNIYYLFTITQLTFINSERNSIIVFTGKSISELNLNLS